MEAFFDSDGLTIKLGRYTITLFHPREWPYKGTGFHRYNMPKLAWYYCGRFLWVQKRK